MNTFPSIIMYADFLREGTAHRYADTGGTVPDQCI